MTKKVLFIDGQVFQSAAWDRGMGKYSLELLKAMLSNKNYNYDKTFIIFTKNMPLDPKAKELITIAAPNATHLETNMKVPLDPSLDDIPAMQIVNEAILEGVISENSVSGDDCSYLILSLFIDQVCTVFPASCFKIILFYDLIPLQYNERYGLLTSYANYLARFKTLLESDLVLTISQTVADDVALNIGISKAKIHNINGAPIARQVLKAQNPKLPAGKDFLLMPSGNDIRKNNVRAVQGFEAYLKESNTKNLVLVLTSFFDEWTRKSLESYSDNIIFTGNVSEAELLWLYENAKALLFVPEYEGLGLPILEAAEVNKPIICSNLTVFNEISPTAFYYSNPFDPLSIATAIRYALDGVDLATKIAEYPSVLARYTWSNTATDALQAMNDKSTLAKKDAKPKLAIMAPTPSGYSAIGKLVMQLHPAMHEYFDIDYYIEPGKTHKNFDRPNYLPYVSNVYPSSSFNRKKYKDYDAVLYHIGNSEFHVDTIKSALHLPGYATFHDTHLTNIFKGELLEYDYVTEDRLLAEEMLDKKIGNQKADYISSIVNGQIGLIAHSDYTQSALDASSLYSTKAAKINLPTATPKQLRPKNEKTSVRIGLAGIIHPAKGLDMIEELAAMDEFAGCNFHIFGLSLVTPEVIRRLESYPNIQVDTNITDFQFQNMLAELDILINYRPDYRGETSLATIEAMRFGVIPVVRKIGWYDELPSSAVIKVSSQKKLVVELQELVASPQKRASMKLAAKDYISMEHGYERYAKEIFELITAEPTVTKNMTVSNEIKKGASVSTVLTSLAN